jgi:hypothetical protein
MWYQLLKEFSYALGKPTLAKTQTHENNLQNVGTKLEPVGVMLRRST